MVLAHGIGTRSDLPVSIGLAAAAAAATLVISFAVLAVLWRRPRRAGAGRPLPAPGAAVLDAPALRAVLRCTALLVAALVVGTGSSAPPTRPRTSRPGRST